MRKCNQASVSQSRILQRIRKPYFTRPRHDSRTWSCHTDANISRTSSGEFKCLMLGFQIFPIFWFTLFFNWKKKSLYLNINQCIHVHFYTEKIKFISEILIVDSISIIVLKCNFFRFGFGLKCVGFVEVYMVHRSV